MLDDRSVSIPFSHNEITVVQEFNVHIKGDKCTVWVAPGFYDDSDDDCPTHKEIQQSMKIVGPIDAAIALETFRALVSVFSQCGFQVSEITTADD